jgi:branched-chain amino acid transport system ATP-binding protein
MLDLNGLAKHFGALRVLDGVELSVPAGAVVGVIGPNGAGKTTLFNVIAGVLSPNAGSVRFDGRDITKMPVWDRCRLGIGRTYQVPKPFSNMTVYENVLAAALHGGGLAMGEAADQADSVLERVGLSHRRATRAGDLSLLDLKRLELAKALGGRPRLLLLDEIAGGLTDAECETLLEIIATVREGGTTIVWIEHVIRALRRVADTIAVLHDGKFIATGAPDAVLVDQRVKDVYLGAGG